MATFTVASGKRATFRESSATNNTYVINDDTKGATISGSVNGDIIAIEGFAGDFTASVRGRVVTLKSTVDTDIVVKFQLASANGTASVRFLDGDLTATYASSTKKTTLGAQTLSSKATTVNDSALGSNDSSSTFDESAGGSGTGATFTLTTAADTETAATFTGRVVADQDADTTTFGPGDTLTGTSGSDDSLTVSVSGLSTVANTINATELNGIETVLVSNFDTNADDTEDTTFDASLWTGVTKLGLRSSNATGDTLFTNVAAKAEIESAGAGDLNVGYDAALVLSTSDSQTLTLKGQTAGTFTVNGIETLNIASTTSANTITLANNAHETVNVSGNRALNLTLTGATIETVNAASATGALTLTLGAGATDISVTGGAGNDIINVTAANIDLNDVINGGNGTDVLATNAAITAANAVGISGIEELETTSGNITQAANIFAGIQQVNVFENDGDTGATVFSNMGASTRLAVQQVGNAADDVTATLATNTNSDAITVSLGFQTAATGALNGVTFDDLTLNNYETITLNNTFAASTVDTLISTGATRVNVNNTSAGVLTVTANTAAAVSTVDASGSTFGVVFTGALGNTTGVSVTGGTGNDSFIGGNGNDTISGGNGVDTLSGGAGNDSISGGAGNDSITAGNGNDILIGGDGDDTFADAAANLDAAATETASVDGGNGNDTFVIADFSDLSSNTTISGGNGNDILSFTENAAHNFTADATIFANISSVETLSFDNLDAGVTVTMNDSNISNGSVTVRQGTGSAGANTYNMSGVLANSNTINFTELSTGVATTYSIGNGKDLVTMDDGNDAFTITNNAFLSSNDALNGGTGTDTATFTSTTNTTFTAAQLGVFANTEVLQVTTGGAGNYAMTLTDAIVGANVAPGNTFTVQRSIVADTGTLSVTGTSVTSNYNLALTGALGADTLIGGSGADTITGGVNDADIDSLTGGSGNDTFVVDTSRSAVDRINDFSFGTSTTQTDVLSFVGGGLVFTLNDYDTVGLQSAGYVADVDVLVLDSASYADVTAVDVAVEAWSNAVTGVNKDLIVLWQDSFGRTHVSAAVGAAGGNGAADGGDEYTITDSVILVGVGITTVADNINLADIIVA